MAAFGKWFASKPGSKLCQKAAPRVPRIYVARAVGAAPRKDSAMVVVSSAFNCTALTQWRWRVWLPEPLCGSVEQRRIDFLVTLGSVTQFDVARATGAECLTDISYTGEGRFTTPTGEPCSEGRTLHNVGSDQRVGVNRGRSPAVSRCSPVRRPTSPSIERAGACGATSVASSAADVARLLPRNEARGARGAWGRAVRRAARYGDRRCEQEPVFGRSGGRVCNLRRLHVRVPIWIFRLTEELSASPPLCSISRAQGERNA